MRDLEGNAVADTAPALILLTSKIDASQVPRLIKEITAAPPADGKVEDREDPSRVAVTAARRTNARARVEMATTTLAAIRQAERKLAKDRQPKA